MDLNSYGPYALPLAIITILAQVLWNVTRSKRKPDSGVSSEVELFHSELRADIKDVKHSIHLIQETLQVLVTKMALTEYRVNRLEDRK